MLSPTSLFMQKCEKASRKCGWISEKSSHKCGRKCKKSSHFCKLLLIMNKK